MELEKAAVNFLLLTATPHNGKDEEFQQWLRLLIVIDSRRRQAEVRNEISRTVRKSAILCGGKSRKIIQIRWETVILPA